MREGRTKPQVRVRDALVMRAVALQSSDSSARQAAEKFCTENRKAAPDGLAIGLLSLVGTSGVDPTARAQGAVLLGQLLQKGQGPEKDFTYARMTPANQAAIA